MFISKNASIYSLYCLQLFVACQAYVVHKQPRDEHLHADTDEKEDILAAKHAAIVAGENPFGKLSNSKCFPLSIPQCKRLGYNSTTYQRTIYNSDGPDTAARYLAFFENELCFEDLLFFVCTLYNPVCMENHDQVILPCRTECQKTKHQCKDTLKKFNMAWPTELKCATLPNYQTDVCLTRDSMVSQPKREHANEAEHQLANHQQKPKKCPMCNKLNTPPHDFKEFKKSDFAIEGQFLSKTQTADGGARLTFLVKKAFKHNTIKIRKYGIVHLWSDTPCLCPPLKFDHKYIMLGQENIKTQQLVFDERTFVVRKTPFWKRLFLQWRRKLRQEKRLKLRTKVSLQNQRIDNSRKL